MGARNQQGGRWVLCSVDDSAKLGEDEVGEERARNPAVRGILRRKIPNLGQISANSEMNQTDDVACRAI